MRLPFTNRRVQAKKPGILAANFVLILTIAAVEAHVKSNLALGYLYLFPMLVGGYFLSRWHTFLLAVLCAVLREHFSALAWQTDAMARSFMTVCGYFGAGLFVRELSVARQTALEQSVLRQEAEEQLRALIESSPAAILTVDAEGRVLQANDAAHRMLDFPSGSLAGEPISSLLPVLNAVPRVQNGPGVFRSTVECTGRRRNGEVFLAQVWFSTYQTVSGSRLAAIVWDGSDELRDREGLGLHSVMNASQILVRAALHEIRNLGAAAAVAHANLARIPGVARSEDFQALGTLVKGLEKIASSELRFGTENTAATVDLHTVLDELRIVIDPTFRESGITIHWEIARDIPPVRGDHQGLLQVFLNLAQNSHRAMQGLERREFTVAAFVADDSVFIRFQDTGRGIPVPDRLFQPQQPGAEATGLGLYISRAIVRSFSGDLRHEPQALGSCFSVQLAPAHAAAAAAAS
jgi:two-component system sensor kinase FixL